MKKMYKKIKINVLEILKVIKNWIKQEDNWKYLLCLILLFYFYCINTLTIQRVVIFISVWIIIYLYVKMHRIMAPIMNFTMGASKEKTEIQLKLKMYIIKNKEMFRKINWVLMKINTWKNPFIIILYKIDKCLYKVYKTINYIIKKKEIKIKKQTLLTIYLLMNLICLGLFTVIFKLFYDIIVSWRNYDAENSLNNTFQYIINRIFIKKNYGVVFMILIFTNIIPIMLNMSIQFWIMLYIILSIIFMILNYNYEKLKEYEGNLLKTDTLKYEVIKNFCEYTFYLCSCVAGLFLINYRNHLLLLGIIIDYINLNLTISQGVKREEWEEVLSRGEVYPEAEGLRDSIEKRVLNLILYQTKTSVMGRTIIWYRGVYLKNRINLKYFEDLGGYGSYLEINFLYLWWSYKAQSKIFYLEKGTNALINEIKNYPSLFLYAYLYFNICFYLPFIDNNKKIILPVGTFMDMLYFEYKITENMNLILKIEEDVEKVLDLLKFSIKFEKSRIKLFFYMLWDIEECLDIENYNYEYWVFHKEEDGIYNLRLKNDIDNDDEVYFLEYKVKKKNAFYDLDQNLDFFMRVFKYVYIIDNNINRQVYVPYHQYYVGEELEIYSKAILYIKYKFAQINISRYHTSYDNTNVELIEEVIKEVTYKYIKEIRKEWEKEKGNKKITNEFSHLESIFQEFKKNNLT